MPIASGPANYVRGNRHADAPVRIVDTMTPTTNPQAAAIERYLAFWNHAPGDDRRRLGRQTFAPDVRYRAPLADRSGLDDLVELAGEFSLELGAITMTSRGEPDLHNDCARLRWELHRDGESFAEGTDVLTFDPDGLVATVTTFIDRPPVGFDPHAHGRAA